MDSINMVTETPTAASQQLDDLIQALEQATHMAKQLLATSDPDHHRLIFSSLNSAQTSLSSFIALHHPDNSVSSAVDEPMTIADDGDGDEEQNSKDSSMEKMEQKMREFLCIQNKRPKRPLSPVAAAVAERQGFEERENVRVPVGEFDPLGSKLRSLDLVYQFHA